MSPEQAIAKIQKGELDPVYLVLGEERYLRHQVVAALQAAYQKDAIPGLNEDDFTAGEAEASRVIGAARTLPMMSKLRWVMVRDLERWEPKSKGEPRDAKKRDGALDELAAYAAAPSETTLMVLLATKLDSRRRLITLAKKQDFLVKCDPIKGNALPAWVRDAAKRRQRTITESAAELVAEVAGPELSVIDDVLERLTLFVEGGRDITEEDVGDLIPVVRPSTVWELVDAVGRGDVGAALASFSRVYDPGDRGLRLLGVLAWSARQLVRFQAARNAGRSPEQAASEASAPPFRAKALDAQVRRAVAGQFEGWLCKLRAIDLELKGSSKKPPRAVLEAGLIDLCRGDPRPRAQP